MVRKLYRGRLAQHRERMQTVEKELEEQQRVEAANRERRKRLEREKMRRQAALFIIQWYRCRKAIVDAKVQLRSDILCINSVHRISPFRIVNV